VDLEYVGELQRTISRLHRCQAAHTRTERVHKEVNGQLLWAGKVEVFALLGHDRALRCYAWGNLNEVQQWEVTTVLAIPPVISAETAVLAALAARIRENEASSDQP
jgi:hypothetical protein